MPPHQPLNVEIDAQPVYEFILSLCVFSDSAEQNTYEVGRSWFAHIRSQAPAVLLAEVDAFGGPCDKLWAHLLTVAYQMPPPRSVPAFLDHLAGLDALELRLHLLGYYIRYFRRATPPETIAAAAAGDPQAQQQFLASSYPADAPWQAALRAILPLGAASTRDRLLAILRDWYEHVFRAREPQLLPILLRDAERLNALARTVPPQRVVDAATTGWEYLSEPGIRQVLLIPTVVARPRIDTLDHHEVKIICYPVADESLDAEGDAPPPRLVRLLKALADERRLRILKRLTTGDYTLQELSTHFGVGNTTMLHHLVVLRAAGLVRLRGGTAKQYSLCLEALPEAPAALHAYLQEGSV